MAGRGAAPVFALFGPGCAAALLLGTTLCLLLPCLPPRWLLQRLTALAAALAVFTLPLPFLLTGPGPSWSWGVVTVSWYGTAVALPADRPATTASWNASGRSAASRKRSGRAAAGAVSRPSYAIVRPRFAS